jgi:hypothetical protein
VAVSLSFTLSSREKRSRQSTQLGYVCMCDSVFLCVFFTGTRVWSLDTLYYRAEQCQLYISYVLCAAVLGRLRACQLCEQGAGSSLLGFWY